MSSVLVDNDILAKTAAYDLFDELVKVLSVEQAELGVLGSVRYVIRPKKLKSAADGSEIAYQRLKSFLDGAEIIEPGLDESRLAAKLEQAAIELNVQLDVGESQLCAIAIMRSARLLCTGDKRAIVAVERLWTVVDEVKNLAQKLVPMEVLVRTMVRIFNYEKLRGHICASRGTDLALEICFQCHNELGDNDEAELGLRSYISHLASEAPNVLGDL